MKAIKRVGTIIISVLLWLVILVAALYAFTTMATKDNQNVANLFGYTPLVVESNSMSPTFKKDDLIFVKKCDTSKLRTSAPPFLSGVFPVALLPSQIAVTH